MSQVHADPDVAIELFLLERTGEPLACEHVYTADDAASEESGPGS